MASCSTVASRCSSPPTQPRGAISTILRCASRSSRPAPSSSAMARGMSLAIPRRAPLPAGANARQSAADLRRQAAHAAPGGLCAATQGARHLLRQAARQSQRPQRLSGTARRHFTDDGFIANFRASILRRRLPRPQPGDERAHAALHDEDARQRRYRRSGAGHRRRSPSSLPPRCPPMRSSWRRAWRASSRLMAARLV